MRNKLIKEKFLNDDSKKIICYVYYAFLISFLFLFPMIYKGIYEGLPNIDINTILYDTQNGYRMNIVPFRTISDYIERILQYQIFHFIWILLGNIMLFVPAGIFLNKKNIIIVLFFIVLKEMFQFICNIGSFDIDTILLNICGIVFGIMIQKYIHQKHNINILSINNN